MNHMGSLSADEKFFVSEVFRDERGAMQRRAPQETVREPARDIGLYGECDVLVVGGGPSGTAAAVAAARLGAEVILLERYNHLGGLATGGLVIWIDRMTDWDGREVILGFAREVLERLPKSAVAGPERGEWGSRDPRRAAYWSQRTSAFHGVVTWSPTIDPERLKLVSQEMVLEHRVKLVFHSWAALPILSAGAVAGAIFESKAGRQAIRAKVTVDATGDGDLFARAGAACESDIEESDIHHCMNTSWLFGGVDMQRWLEFKAGRAQEFTQFMQLGRERLRLFDKPFVSWRNDIALFMGPRLAGFSALDPDDLTAVEIRSRRLMDAHLDFYRAHAPGFEHAHLLYSAPQLGVRHSRRLVGVSKVTRGQWSSALVHPDEIGISPSLSPKFPNISIPYGCLVPAQLDGLIACGRHIACDPNSHSFLREIPQCWVTGQAAGVAAALAAARGTMPRALDAGEIQDKLVAQGAVLRRAGEIHPAVS
jgi:hypothetical protein